MALRSWASRVSQQTLSDFFDQLATLLAAGTPLLQSLDFSANAIRDRKLTKALQTISANIRSGMQFSEALAVRPDIFDRVVIGMIKAAEASGRLEAVSRHLSRAFGAQAEMRSRIFQALAYPALVASVGVVTVCVLLVFVVPKLTAVFELWDAPLPLITRILLGVSAFMSHGGFLVLMVTVVLFLLFLRFLNPHRRKQLSYSLVVRIPFLKELFFLADFVRLCRTWGMLLKSGVPLIEAICSSEDVVWNPEIKATLGVLREKVIRGSALQEAVREAKWFPDLAQNYLSVGETTGTLDESFEKISLFYERDFDRKVKLLGTFLEPALILLIGLVVGFLVISLLLPIFEMSLVVR